MGVRQCKLQAMTATGDNECSRGDSDNDVGGNTNDSCAMTVMR